MKASCSTMMGALGLLGLSAAALAQAPAAKPAAEEPVGFVTGAVIGGFAAGPVGAVLGAGLGAWLGNRVHRAGEAGRAEAQAASLRMTESELEESNRALTARLDQLAQGAEAAQALADDGTPDMAAKVLDGLQGEVLFRTGSAAIPAETAHELEALAGVLARSPALSVRLDGYADPRGSAQGNLELSEARADAVRDLLLAAGVRADALEVNAYGKSRSTAGDSDGYALERRVRMTLQAAPLPAAAGVQTPVAARAAGDAGR